MRIRWKGIENLALYIVGAQVLVYLFNLWDETLLQSLVFYPPWVLGGEWWRVATFLFIPPLSHPLLAVFWFYLFYLYGAALEAEWGSGAFTLYYLIGALATVAAGLFFSLGPVPNFFLNTSIFLAFATLFPDFELAVFYVLPVKVKYIALLTAAFWGYLFVRSGPSVRWIVAAAVLNYGIFFAPRFVQWVKLRIEVARNRRRFKGGL